MEALRRTLAICGADLRERMRSPRLWIVLAVMAAATWWAFPAADADYLTVSLRRGERALYSSAWMGMVIALMGGTLLSLAGFYVVRGTVARDLETKVWQLLVATPMTRAGYLLAKWLSHLTVFAVIVAAMLAVALVVQLVRGEDPRIDLLELAKPALLLVLPSLAVTAMLAIWFDLVPWLRRTAGNVLFFFLWGVLTSIGINAGRADVDKPGLRDPAGFATAAIALHEQRGLAGGQEFALSVGKQSLDGQPPRTFEWRGWSVSATDAAGRVAWLAIALGGLLLAAPLLDRFAAHRGAASTRSSEGRQLRWLDRALAPLQRGRMGSLVAAEVQLVLRQRRRRWWLAMAIVTAGQFMGHDKGLVAAILAAWLLSLDVFARQVLRERDTRTSALVFAAPDMRWRLLAARAMVAVAFAWLVTAPALLRLFATTPASGLALLAAGASIAVWGLASGAFCRNARPFELALVAAAYVSVQGALVLDVLAAPLTTAFWHAALLPLGAILLLAARLRMHASVR